MIISAYQHQDHLALLALANKTLPTVHTWLFKPSSSIFVAKINDTLVGAAVLQITQDKGIVSWLLVDPDHQNKGIGTQLIEQATVYFTEHNCKEMLANIEGYNFASSRSFEKHGFRIIPFTEQYLKYSSNIFVIWKGAFHLFDFGHSLWQKNLVNESAVAKSDIRKTGLLQWIFTFAFLFLLSTVIKEGAFFATFIALFSILFLRYYSMKVMAKLQSMPVHFRAWESGFAPTFLLAILPLNLVFPNMGNVYPNSIPKNNSTESHKLYLIALSGVVLPLILVGLAWLLQFFGFHNSLVSAMVNTGRAIVFFDVALPFVPFAGFNGKRIYQANRKLWQILAITAAIIYLWR